MRRPLRAAILAVAAMLSVAPVGSAGAAVDEARLAEAIRATGAFEALAAGSRGSGAAPRESDPAAAELLSRILDAGVLGDGPPTMADVAAVSTLLRNAMRVLAVYMLAGTGIASLDAVGGDAAALSLVEANMARHAPEVGRLYDFAARLQGRVASAVAGFRDAAAPAEAKAIEAELGALRAGILQTLGAILDDAGDDDFDASWRKERVMVLGDVGPDVARVLEEDDLAVLREKAAAMAEETSDLSMRTELRRLMLVLRGR